MKPAESYNAVRAAFGPKCTNEGLASIVETATGKPITDEAVRVWQRRGVPGKYVVALCRIAKGRLQPHDLRPDLYPHPGWIFNADGEPSVSTRRHRTKQP